MTFAEFIQNVESRIGETYTANATWTSTILSITERKQSFIRINVRFSTSGFSFERELKLHESNFDTANKLTNELERQVRRLDRYSTAISEMSVIDPLPNITNNWKGKLTRVTIISPVQATLTYSFFRNFDSAPTFITKETNVFAESFSGKQTYNDWVDAQVLALNAPIDISYYENLIKTI